jgi:hypothetical protein
MVSANLDALLHSGVVTIHTVTSQLVPFAPYLLSLSLSLSYYDTMTTSPLQYKTKTTAMQLTNIGIKYSRNTFGSRTQDSNKKFILGKFFSSHPVRVGRCGVVAKRSVNMSFSL